MTSTRAPRGQTPKDAGHAVRGQAGHPPIGIC